MYKLCPKCSGDGVVPSPAALRFERKQARKGLTETADRMGISAGYLCDLEHGRREWSPELINKFKSSIK